MDAGPASEYELLDLGGGRQLARFGALVVDRPYPAAGAPAFDQRAWAAADLRYERDYAGSGRWTAAADTSPDAWQLRHDGLTFELRPTPAGQVGFFAEQMEPWQWIRESVTGLAGTCGAHVADVAGAGASDGVSVINLFGYTGGATLAAAAAGASVTHVDSSRPAVAWARRNAELSGLGEAAIRWIVDDALTFVEREQRRGRRYNGLILDPPSYGHGPRGERWTLTAHLPVLLDACLAVADPSRGFILVTAHAGGLQPEDLAGAVRDAFSRAGRRSDAGRITAETLTLRATSGATAPAGASARWRR